MHQIDASKRKTNSSIGALFFHSSNVHFDGERMGAWNARQYSAPNPQ
jgi:hypothetical protein